MKFNKILIIRLSAIGDVINTIPAMVVLRQNFPKSFICWVVEDKAQELLRAYTDSYLVPLEAKPREDNNLSKSLTSHSKDASNGLGSPSRLLLLDKVFIFNRRTIRVTKHLTLIKELRQSNFDIAIDLQGNLKSGLISSLSGAEFRVGMSPAKEGNIIFSNYRVALPNQKINRVERNLFILKQLGLNINTLKWDKIPPPFTKDDEHYINKLIGINNPENKPIVIIHPGTSEFGAFKRWQSEKYAQLADKLIEALNICCVIVWSGREKTLAESIASRMKHKAVVIPEQLTLNKLAALIKQSRLFIGSDSAPLHLANLVGTRLIGLYGPKDPIIYGPYQHPKAQNKTIVIRKELPCSPCQKRRCDKPICMESITVDEVFQRALGNNAE